MVRMMLLLLVVAPMILISCAGTGQKMNDGAGKYGKWIKVDVRKGLEWYKFTPASSDEDAGEIMFDFKKNLTMIKLPKAKSCFLKNWIGNVPKPAAVQTLLHMGSRRGKVEKPLKSSVEQLMAGVKLDSSVLSSEMAYMCQNLTIYRVTKRDVNQNDMNQMDEEDEESDPAQEHAKRGYFCGYRYYYRCVYIPYTVRWYWGRWRTYYRTVCVRVCVRHYCG